MKKRGIVAEPGKLPPKTQNAKYLPDEGHREQDRVRDANAGARDQVVGQGVAEEPVGDREYQQRETDGPVEFAGLAEGAGEEHARHVHDQRPTKMSQAQWCIWRISSPPRTLNEMIYRRLEGLGDALTIERQIRTVIDDHRRTRHEVQREKDAGDEQDHEGVQRDLTEHEGPVIREDLVHEGASALGDT